MSDEEQPSPRSPAADDGAARDAPADDEAPSGAAAVDVSATARDVDDGGPSDAAAADESASPGDVDDGGNSGAAADQPPASDATATSPDADGVAWLFLLGLAVFVASVVAVVADLVTGHDVRRSLVANGVGSVLLVAWAGLDSYRDPDSGVQTVGGAVGTGLILVGIYLLLAGAVVAVTSPVHDRLLVGVAMVAGGVPLILGGFVAYPIDSLLGDASAGAGGSEAGRTGSHADGAAASDDEADVEG